MVKISTIEISDNKYYVVKTSDGVSFISMGEISKDRVYTLIEMCKNRLMNKFGNYEGITAEKYISEYLTDSYISLIELLIIAGKEKVLYDINDIMPNVVISEYRKMLRRTFTVDVNKIAAIIKYCIDSEKIRL